MSLKLSDMDDFTLAELDDFTLDELDKMSYAQLFTAVQAKYQIADKRCDKNTPLSDEQTQAVTKIIHMYMKEYERVSLREKFTIGVAISIVADFLSFLAGATVNHIPEIAEVLKQAYILLYQLIQQAPS